MVTKFIEEYGPILILFIVILAALFIGIYISLIFRSWQLKNQFKKNYGERYVKKKDQKTRQERHEAPTASPGPEEEEKEPEDQQIKEAPEDKTRSRVQTLPPDIEEDEDEDDWSLNIDGAHSEEAVMENIPEEEDDPEDEVTDDMGSNAEEEGDRKDPDPYRQHHFIKKSRKKGGLLSQRVEKVDSSTVISSELDGMSKEEVKDLVKEYLGTQDAKYNDRERAPRPE